MDRGVNKLEYLKQGLYLDSAQLNPAQLISAQIITTGVKRLKE